MPGSVDLKLFVGPAVPVPAPRAVIEALENVQVQVNGGDTPSGFELTFALSKRSPLQTLFLLTGGSSIPILRVVIMVTMGSLSEVIMDGVMRLSVQASRCAQSPASRLKRLMDISPVLRL